MTIHGPISSRPKSNLSGLAWHNETATPISRVLVHKMTLFDFIFIFILDNWMLDLANLDYYIKDVNVVPSARIQNLPAPQSRS